MLHVCTRARPCGAPRLVAAAACLKHCGVNRWLQFIRGMHSVFLARWLRHIPNERLLAIRADDYFQDGENTVRQVRAPRRS